MQYVPKKSSTKLVALQTRSDVQALSNVTPAADAERQVQRDLQRFTARPASLQRQVAAPVLRAAGLHAQETGRLASQQHTLQRQVEDLTRVLPAGAVDTALQRQAQASLPAPVIRTPQSPSDWVTVMRQQAEQVEGQRLDPKTYGQFTALQRQVAGLLTTAFQADRQPAGDRHQAFASQLVSLQRHPLSRPVAQVVLSRLPADERPAIQRVVDDLHAQDALQRHQDEQALQLHALQRQLADLDEQATQPIMDRIQARRGSGNPLPAAVQRHLEQGLNHDLSHVRIHDDAEADKLAKGVHAIAFTTGSDIFFQSGTFNPNTQSGLELLAHEVTHTVQQAQGKVGKGLDPDAGLEAEARQMGRRLAGRPFTSASLGARRRGSVQPGRAAVQRAADIIPPGWKVTASPALIEQLIQKDTGQFLRQLLGKTTGVQLEHQARNRSTPQAIPSFGRIFLASIDELPIKAALKQKLLDTAIYQSGLPLFERRTIAQTAVALKRTDAARGQAIIKALDTKIAKAASMDHIGDFGKAVGSRLVGTVVGIYKMAKFVAWDSSTIRMLVDFPGYQKMWINIGQTGSAIVQNPGLLWDAMTKDMKEAWSKGEYGKSLGYVTFDVASLVTGMPGAARAAATVPSKVRVVVALAKDAKGNLVTRVTEVGDDIRRGMQLTANDLGIGRSPALAAANVGGGARSAAGTGAAQGTTAPPARVRVNTPAAVPDELKPLTRVEGKIPAPAGSVQGVQRQVLLARYCDNWAAVQPFIRKKAGPGNLPPGYKYLVTKLSNGKTLQLAYQPKGLPGSVPKLRADDAGNWQPDGLTFKNGDVSRDYRIAQSTEYNANNPPPLPGSGLTNNHHLWPDNVMRNNPFFQEGFRRGLISPDRGPNMLTLAKSADALKVLRQKFPTLTFNDILHLTSHPNYDALVRAWFNKAYPELLKSAGAKPGTAVHNLTDAQLIKIRDGLDLLIQERFKQPPQDLLNIIKDDSLSQRFGEGDSREA
ncbi:DUF4157 domain-containing protein [Deinococcus enclensis]|uniref:eCIS core domain-containing protein n=1 Tax=Deinococcus enclensis TaxID=1049582 RepID=A0ABT9MG04_9DEIO|nr:DUF4157 domain-containing protein [Deinococcus enclensis]MDP9765486.1 hypothetical protein [Deinococcus enclensis]